MVSGKKAKATKIKKLKIGMFEKTSETTNTTTSAS